MPFLLQIVRGHCPLLPRLVGHLCRFVSSMGGHIQSPAFAAEWRLICSGQHFRCTSTWIIKNMVNEFFVTRKIDFLSYWYHQLEYFGIYIIHSQLSGREDFGGYFSIKYGWPGLQNEFVDGYLELINVTSYTYLCTYIICFDMQNIPTSSRTTSFSPCRTNVRSVHSRDSNKGLIRFLREHHIPI